VIECPRPDKIRYRTRRAAKKAARDQHLAGQRRSAYKCMCGSYHLGRLNEFTVAGYSLDRWNRPQRPLLRESPAAAGLSRVASPPVGGSPSSAT
jgi:hypothetical protein